MFHIDVRKVSGDHFLSASVSNRMLLSGGSLNSPVNTGLMVPKITVDNFSCSSDNSFRLGLSPVRTPPTLVSTLAQTNDHYEPPRPLASTLTQTKDHYEPPRQMVSTLTQTTDHCPPKPLTDASAANFEAQPSAKPLASLTDTSTQTTDDDIKAAELANVAVTVLPLCSSPYNPRRNSTNSERVGISTAV